MRVFGAIDILALCCEKCTYSGGVAEWLRRSVLSLVRSTCVALNSIVETTDHKPTSNSAVHPSGAGKGVHRSNSEGTSTGHIGNS